AAQLAALKAPARPQQIAQLRSALAAAQQQLKLTQAPFMEQDLEAARAQVTQAQSALDMAKTRLDEASVRSPMDGYVAVRNVSVGDLAVGEPVATTLFVIISVDVEVVVTADERSLNHFKIGQPVRIAAMAYPDRLFEGSIKAVSPSANPATRTFEVFATVSDPQGLLRPGMSATLSLAPRQGG
ncbi:MAG: efflux RND transporter periplasmic adaptor subunit, partial [Chloroflexota bacterium]|nr:efflux RND transporter periplasmic adaptor subunit [Chloroflexota bacterium]